MTCVANVTDARDLFVSGAVPAPVQPAFTLRDGLHLLFKHGRLIAGCTALVTALVWTGAAMQPRPYVGTAKLWIKTEQQAIPAFLTGIAAYRDSVAPDPVNRKIETEMELLLSRDNAEQVIRQLKIRPNQLVRSPLQVIGDQLPALPLPLAGRTPAHDESSQQQALIDSFIKSFRIEPLRSKGADTTSNVLEIRFSATDADLVPAAVNSLLQHYIEQASSHNRQLGQATFELLEARAEEARRDLAESERAMVGFLAAQGDRVSRAGGGGTPGSQVVASMQSQNSDLKQRLDDLRQIYTEEAQNVKALDRSISTLQERLRREVRANAEADAELARLERRRSLAQERFVELRKRLDQIDIYLQVNPSEAESRVVTQRPERPTLPDGKQRQLALVLGPLAGLLLGLALAALRQMGDRRIETPEELARWLGLNTLAAVPVLSPDRPVAHQLDRADGRDSPRTLDPRALVEQEEARARVLAEGVSLLPDTEDLHRQARELHSLVAGGTLSPDAPDSRSPAGRDVLADVARQPRPVQHASDRGLLMHRLALRVREALPRSGHGRILVVASARPGEGKSVIARSLAKRLMQQQGGRVLLIDGSAEAPAGHAGSRGAGKPGFFDLLRHAGTRAAAIASRSDDRLHLLPAGQGVAGSLLFHEAAVHELFGKLRERYRWTVVDAGTLAQIGCLGAQADGVLLVVDADSTRREVVRGALDTARLPAGRLLGAVLNRRPQYVPAWAYRHWL